MSSNPEERPDAGELQRSLRQLLSQQQGHANGGTLPPEDEAMTQPLDEPPARVSGCNVFTCFRGSWGKKPV